MGLPDIITSFPPVAAADAELLILGSVPGEASLRAGQYYAHPHNSFWKIMGVLLGAGPELSYTERIARLTTRKIAVWDVLKHCRRAGSLDSAISNETANDFNGFFKARPSIRAVFFNGAKAEKSFARLVMPDLGHQVVSYARLPSTSPAHASMRFAEKVEAWRAIADFSVR